MATIYYVKDGPGPKNSGPGRTVQLPELGKIVQEQGIDHKYLGKKAPQFNPRTPSEYPSRVVIEIESGDSKSSVFTEVGFYILLGLSPQEAEKIFSKAIGQLRL